MAEVHVLRPTLVWEVATLAEGLDEAELDREGWRLQAETGEDLDDAIWFAIHSVVPATLLWLRVHRQSHPQLFVMAPG